MTPSDIFVKYIEHLVAALVLAKAENEKLCRQINTIDKSGKQCKYDKVSAFNEMMENR